MKLISAAILICGFTFCLFAQETTNNVPQSDERAIRLENAPLFMCLDIYTELTGKKVKNETISPVDGITFRTESSIPKGELAMQLEECLKMKGVKLIPSGTNEVRALTIQSNMIPSGTNEVRALTIRSNMRVQQCTPPNRRSPSAPTVGGC